ncbi:MAG TPA: hypothetical protein VFY73_23890 [Ideonella sp.]|uniref:hypothetical protein n=1 Tax=Ideonella sp. TaxID=1929293 RepID=UPI002E33F480|nr:hypothetical protein [Ideonella sp.]HEX5687067.1 hypothetical protein [Ideonella sp.]
MNAFQWLAALLAVTAGGPVVAGDTSPVVIQIDAAATLGPYRTDISRRTFGSGVEFSTAQWRWTFDNLSDVGGTPVSSKTADTIDSLSLGTLRFPNGNSSFLYIWDDPIHSYPSLPHPTQWNAYLTPAEINRYTAADSLDMERLFEVNTVFWLKYNPWGFQYINKNQFSSPPLPPEIDPTNLSIAASKAAAWVASPEGATTLWWEVGNEDWSRWNASQHADIFFEFQGKMKAARPEIKLLAQGLAADYQDNKAKAWLDALKSKLSDAGKLDSVYAYSIHQYLSAKPYEGASLASRRKKQTQEMLYEVDRGAEIENVKALLGTDDPHSPTRSWKIWMTEFNVFQNNAAGEFQVLQDMGHALVMADWTGKLLEQNVERMFYHSLDTHPAFSLVQYANGTHPGGEDIEFPQVQAPGYAYSIYAQQFGKTMVRNRIKNNRLLTTPNGKHHYGQVSTYSSISEDESSLRVMVINRDLNKSVSVNLNTMDTNPRRTLADGKYGYRVLRSDRLTDNNHVVKDTVRWTDTAYFDQTAGGLKNVKLPPASANLFILPLAPRVDRAAGPSNDQASR